MKSIETIQSLISALDAAERNERAKVISRLDLKPEALADYATWSKEEYTRNCIARTEKYELILLCWDQAAETPIHDHGGQECWVCQIEGTVKEERIKQVGEELITTETLLLTPGRVTYMNDSLGFHTIINPSKQRAMTLHVYAKPIDACKVFNTKKEVFKVKEMEYDTIADIN